MLEIGRVCIKTAGREAGRACVVIDTIDETYVMITGPKNLTRVKRRKCNIAHLEPLDLQLKLAKNAPDSEVEKLLQAEKILEKLTAGKPIAKPKKPLIEKPEKEEAPEKKGLRERILGRAKKEEPEKLKGERPEKLKEEKPKKPEKPKGEPKAEKKPGKPKGKPKPKKEEKPKKGAKKPKPAKAPAKTKPAKKAKPGKKKK